MCFNQDLKCLAAAATAIVVVCATTTAVVAVVAAAEHEKDKNDNPGAVVTATEVASHSPFSSFP